MRHSDAIDQEAATSKYQMRVRFCETDMMGVVHHANYLLYCEAARVDWLKRRGACYREWMERGIHLPVVEVKLRYKCSAEFDDLLELSTTLIELSRVSGRFRYQIRRDDVLLCEAETLLACVNDQRKLTRLPSDVVATFKGADPASLIA